MPTTRRHKIVLAVLVGLIVCGIVRSAIATRLDSFDLDEAYHITAGVAYFRLGDYRLNPEHPPLVKLWVGAFMPRAITTPKLRPMSEKWDERHFTEVTVFEQNDADLAQRYARIAMFTLNGILLLVFALSVWRAFGPEAGPAMAIGALAFLIVDPTTAAHLPVVLTDLPVALLASTAVLLAWTAFRSGRVLDTSLAALALGFTLAAKHTGLIVAVSVALLGAVMALRHVGNRPRLRRMGQVLLVLVLAWITLWAMYRFRLNESAEGMDLFNRPLATKIADLHRPWLQQSVTLMTRAHLFPRAYLWGLADILHVGIEGRVAPFYFINRYYLVSAPWYFFPTILLVRLPLGLLALSLMGLVLALSNRTWSGREPLFVLLAFGALMLLMLMRGKSSYAGIRHALFIVPPLAALAAGAFTLALEKKKRMLSAGLALAMIAALASAIPVMRPWEYYNELVGGKDNAWHYFSDEGLDSGQRAKEVAAYYRTNLKPKGEIPFDAYFESYSEDDFRQVPTLQKVWRDNPAADTSDVISGTFMVPAGSLAPNPYIDFGPLRDTQPVARFGNLMIFRGSFALPGPHAARFADRALDAEFSDHDFALAQQLLTRSLEIAPGVYYRWIALGNVLMQRGERDKAIQAFENAAKYVPPGDEMVEPIQTQIQRLSRNDLKTVPLLRNPVLE